MKKNIVRDLENCVYGRSVCKDCGYNQSDDCQRTMMIDALNLITKIKAENKTLKEELQRVTENYNCQQIVCGDFCDIIKRQADELKAAVPEALKEFISRLREKLYGVPTVYNAHFSRMIDEVLEEITEVNEDD